MNNSTIDTSKTIDLKVIDTKLYVKYMVCLRDKMILRSELDRLGLKYEITVFGAIGFLDEITKAQYDGLKKNLSKSGLVLLDKKRSMLIDRIINTIVEEIHYTDKIPKLNYADLINISSGSDDESILKIFSDVKGMSVLQFIVTQKIERVKELLLYDDKPLSEIAELLNYKNEENLIAQFKKVTGLTPSYFTQLKKARQEISSKS